MNSKSGKIYLLATIKYTWCAYLPPPFTGISHYSSLRNLTWHSYLVYLWFYKLFQWSSYALPHLSRIINLLHIIILITWQAWHINSKMNRPPNYQEMGFSPSSHIYKNLPRSTVFRKLKCPDPSMIPLSAEVKECLQKSIRLTSYIPI